ncbi:MAG: 4'-phosphopantetheinyl transferase superfamily protein [Pseudomonas sp.]|uniref:4'-phosphopantetheinyl transferase family protein n=1 Tax=Pseudomonas sp. TaxID=306 RepID=UPI00339170A7
MKVFWLANDRPWPARLAARISARLPATLVARADRLQRWQDRQASLAGKLLLASALQDAQVSVDLETLRWSPYGRPQLPGQGDFNIAHTDGRVLCAWSAQGRVGVDIERLRPVRLDDYLGFFSTAEQRCIAVAARPEHELVRRWTIKEAVTKAAGLGIASGALPDTMGEGPIAFDGCHWWVETVVSEHYARTLASDTALGGVPLLEMGLDEHADLHPRGEPACWH